MISMKNLFRKILSPSTATILLSGAIMITTISCVIAAAPKSDLEADSLDPIIESGEPTRIEAPETEVDTYAHSLLSPVTIGSQSFASPEVEPETIAPEVEPETKPETTVPEAKAPETAAAETKAPETKAPETKPVEPETTAPETEAVTTAPETKAPETEPVSEAPKKVESSGDTSWADKYGVEYTIVKPEFSVSEHEIQLAAAVIQLEVMGGGSKVDAFEDKTEKYDEMLSVAEVIRNRVDSDRFPNTVEEVIRQKIGGVCQFSPVEKLEKTLASGKVTEGAIAAAREALITGVMVKPDSLCYFCATYTKESFEKNNAAALVPDGKGSYVQWEGHLTTFYAGNIN